MSEDGIWNLRQLLNEYKKLPDEALAAVKDQIDIEAAEYEKTLRDRSKGELLASITREKIDDDSVYGYRIDFKGVAKNGKKYHDIAWILNTGNRNKEGRYFITRAENKLKGMSGRIEQRISKVLNEVKNG